MPQREQLLWRFLRVLPQMLGKENAKTSVELRRLLGIETQNGDVQLRTIAKKILNEKEIALCSGPTGFYVAETRAEILEFKDNLIKRQAALSRNIRTLAKLLYEKPRYRRRKISNLIKDVVLRGST